MEGVTKLSALHATTKVAQQAESLRKMILAMADDIRVVLIKLADRLHNMRTLKYHKKPEKQAAIAQETLDIYAPIAARLGIFWIKNELEEIAFFYTLREEHDRILTLVNKARTSRKRILMRSQPPCTIKWKRWNCPARSRDGLNPFTPFIRKCCLRVLSLMRFMTSLPFASFWIPCPNVMLPWARFTPCGNPSIINKGLYRQSQAQYVPVHPHHG